MTPFALLGFAGINIEMVFIWVQNIVHHVREELLPKYWQDIRLCLPRCLEKLGECQEQGCANAIMSIILSFKSRTGWITLLKIGEMKQRSSLHFFFLNSKAWVTSHQYLLFISYSRVPRAAGKWQRISASSFES